MRPGRGRRRRVKSRVGRIDKPIHVLSWMMRQEIFCADDSHFGLIRAQKARRKLNQANSLLNQQLNFSPIRSNGRQTFNWALRRRIGSLCRPFSDSLQKTSITSDRGVVEPTKQCERCYPGERHSVSGEIAKMLKLTTSITERGPTPKCRPALRLANSPTRR
jgi:hypothetical protein